MSDEKKDPKDWREMGRAERRGRLSREHAEELLRYLGGGTVPEGPPSRYKLREAIVRVKGLDAESVLRLWPEEMHDVLHELGVGGHLEAAFRFPGHGEVLTGEPTGGYHNDMWHTDAHGDYTSMRWNWPGHSDAHTDYQHSDTRQPHGDTKDGKKHSDTGEHLDTGAHGDYPHGDHTDDAHPSFIPHFDTPAGHHDHTDAAREPIHCDYREVPHGDREGKHVDV